jgi:hypothetical protein
MLLNFMGRKRQFLTASTTLLSSSESALFVSVTVSTAPVGETQILA